MAGLPAEIKIRVTASTRQQLESIAASRREGTKISDIAREALGGIPRPTISTCKRRTIPRYWKSSHLQKTHEAPIYFGGSEKNLKTRRRVPLIKRAKGGINPSHPHINVIVIRQQMPVVRL